MKQTISLRKILLTMLAAVCCMTVTACAAAEPEPSAPPEETAEESLEIWTFYDRNVPGYYYMFLWDDIAEEYGVTVDVRNYSSDEMENRLSLALVTGELPDIFLSEGGSYLDEFVEAGVCATVDDYLSDADLSEDYAKEYAGGSHYLIPCMLDDYAVVYYNKRLLEEMGLTMPETWEDLEALVRTVNAYNRENSTDYSAISFGGKDGYEGMLLFDLILAGEEWESPGETASGENQLLINQETFDAAADQITRLNAIGAFSENYMETGDEEAVTNFINQKSVMLVNHSAILSHLVWNMGDGFYTGVFPGNRTEDGRYQMVRVSDGAPAGLCINASCSDKALAGQICMAYLKRVDSENVKAGCKRILKDTEGKAERMTERRIEMNSLIDSAAGTVMAPSSLLSQDERNAVKAQVKDLYSGR